VDQEPDSRRVLQFLTPMPGEPNPPLMPPGVHEKCLHRSIRQDEPGLGDLMRRYWWLALGALLVVAGVAVVVASHRWGEASFGWFVYSPRSESAPNIEDQLSRGVREFWAGITLAVVGLLVIAGGVGYRLGLRSGLDRREG